jgi:hypothetical protein
MSERETRWRYCAGPDDLGGCGEKIRDHAWGHIKAEGWFFSKETGKAYCPEHNPPWVEEWRAKKRAGCQHLLVSKSVLDQVYRCKDCRTEMTVSVLP